MTAPRFYFVVMSLVVAFWLGLGPLAATARAQPSASIIDDRANSVGLWDVAAVEVNGRPVDPKMLAMLRVAYRADGSWAVYFKSLPVAEGTSTNRQDELPKTFEMATLGSEGVKPSRYTGIYKQDGDTRVLCFIADGKPRPNEFAAPGNSGRTLVTLKRAQEP